MFEPRIWIDAQALLGIILGFTNQDEGSGCVEISYQYRNSWLTSYSTRSIGNCYILVVDQRLPCNDCCKQLMYCDELCRCGRGNSILYSHHYSGYDCSQWLDP